MINEVGGNNYGRNELCRSGCGKKEYAKEGVHKGMRGWICLETRFPGCWLVNFPQYGEKPDIATIGMPEDDLILLPHMDALVNERIKAEFEQQAGK